MQNIFQHKLNPIWNCGTVEVTVNVHYLLHFSNFSNDRLTHFNKLRSIDENILNKDDSNILKVFLFVEYSSSDVKDIFVLISIIHLSRICLPSPHVT